MLRASSLASPAGAGPHRAAPRIPSARDRSSWPQDHTGLVPGQTRPLGPAPRPPWLPSLGPHRLQGPVDAHHGEARVHQVPQQPARSPAAPHPRSRDGRSPLRRRAGSSRADVLPPVRRIDGDDMGARRPQAPAGSTATSHSATSTPACPAASPRRASAQPRSRRKQASAVPQRSASGMRSLRFAATCAAGSSRRRASARRVASTWARALVRPGWSRRSRATGSADRTLAAASVRRARPLVGTGRRVIAPGGGPRRARRPALAGGRAAASGGAPRRAR